MSIQELISLLSSDLDELAKTQFCLDFAKYWARLETRLAITQEGTMILCVIQITSPSFRTFLNH